MTTREDTKIEGRAAAANRAIGAMFFALFGGCWLALGLPGGYGVRLVWSTGIFPELQIPSGLLGGYGIRLVPLLVVGAGSMLLFFAALRQFRRNRGAHAAEADSPESQRAGRIFNAVNAIQWMLIFMVAAVLSRLGYPGWILPAIIFIVGVHFFPLAHAFKVPRHYATGAALTLLAVVYPLMARAGPTSPVGCLGAGIILWASAVAALARPA